MTTLGYNQGANEKSPGDSQDGATGQVVVWGWQEAGARYLHHLCHLPQYTNLETARVVWNAPA